MKCTCEECQGTGTVECPDCSGHGYQNAPIESIYLHPEMDHYDELKELKADALRVIEQHKKLSDMKPDRRESYDRQKLAALKEIEKQANAMGVCK